MTQHKIGVVFTLVTEPIGPWSSAEVALDHIRHVIDEGYTYEGDWDFLPATYEAIPDPEKVQPADPESYSQASKAAENLSEPPW